MTLKFADPAAVSIDEEVKLKLGEIEYLLIPNSSSFVVEFDGGSNNDPSPILFLLYVSLYRPRGLLNGYASLNLSPILRAPEVTVPVGQTSLDSKVTKRTEPYPVAASILGPPGTDLIITRLVESGMREAGIPCRVETGAAPF